MASMDRELAQVIEVRASQIGEFLLLGISGEKPDGCHVVGLERSLLDVEPPAFIATWYRPPNVRCVLETVAYEYQEAFLVGVMRDVITVHHAGGELSVEVNDLTPQFQGLLPPDIGFTEAIGYSEAFDFNEAFRDAVDKIPVPPIADWLMSYTVVDVGAEIGGIRGLNRMTVRVRGG